MVQFFDMPQSRGSMLGSQVGQGIAGGFGNSLNAILNSQMQAKAQQQKVQALSSLLGGGQNQSQQGAQQQTEEPDNEGYSAGQLIAAEQLFPGAGKILQEEQKQRRAKAEEVKANKRSESTISNMLKVLPSVGPGKIGNVLTEKGRRERQYFDSLSINLEQRGAEMVGKGTLSKARFDFLLHNLPSSSKTQAANIGALKAWSETLGVEVPGLSEQKMGEEPGVKEKGSIPKATAGQNLTKELANSFLEMANGDKEKARKIARKYGYGF